MKLASGIAPVAALLRARASTSRSAPTAPRRTTGSICSARCGSRRCSPRSPPATPAALPAHDGAAHGDAGRRARARARARRSARSCRARRPTSSRSTLGGVDARCPATIRCRIWSTSSGREHVTDVWVAGERVVADRALDDRRRSALSCARAALWQERTAMTTARHPLARPAARQRRSGRAREVRARSRITGGIPRARVQAAARDQSAAPRLDRRVSPAASPASAWSTSAAAAASSPKRWPRAARAVAASISARRRWASRSCISSSPASSVDYRLDRRRSARRRDARRASTSSPAWSCSSTCPIRRRSSPPARRSRSPGGIVVVLDDQPQSQVVPVRDRRRRIRAAAAAARHARLRAVPASPPRSPRFARRAGLELAEHHRHDLQPAREDVPPRARHVGQLHDGVSPRRPMR